MCNPCSFLGVFLTVIKFQILRQKKIAKGLGKLQSSKMKRRTVDNIIAVVVSWFNYKNMTRAPFFSNDIRKKKKKKLQTGDLSEIRTF